VKAPNPNLQAPEKHQASIIKQSRGASVTWSLNIGISLGFGLWCLVFLRGSAYVPS
jgi:hypothetical protein